MAEFEVKASARFQRISALKVHKIVDAVKNKPVELSLNTLHFIKKRLVWSKKRCGQRLPMRKIILIWMLMIWWFAILLRIEVRH